MIRQGVWAKARRTQREVREDSCESRRLVNSWRGGLNEKEERTAILVEEEVLLSAAIVTNYSVSRRAWYDPWIFY